MAGPSLAEPEPFTPGVRHPAPDLAGRRVFKMAPIHHHFEQLGWTEPQVVIRFWIVSVVLALVGLATLKLR